MAPPVCPWSSWRSTPAPGRASCTSSRQRPGRNRHRVPHLLRRHRPQPTRRRRHVRAQRRVDRLRGRVAPAGRPKRQRAADHRQHRQRAHRHSEGSMTTGDVIAAKVGDGLALDGSDDAIQFQDSVAGLDIASNMLTLSDVGAVRVAERDAAQVFYRQDRLQHEQRAVRAVVRQPIQPRQPRPRAVPRRWRRRHPDMPADTGLHDWRLVSPRRGAEYHRPSAV